MQPTETIIDTFEEHFDRRAERERAELFRARRRCATCITGSCSGRRRFCTACDVLAMADRAASKAAPQ